MPIIGNKRVTQLVELTAGEISFDDLFYIVDVSARESKRIKTSELSAWLNGSGSIYAFYAVTAGTASWATNVVGNTVGSSSTSNFAVSALSASWASQSFRAVSSSYALTASYALNGNNTGSPSASFLVYTGTPNGTASYALNALTSDTSTATQFLLYFGGNNGTASYAMQAEDSFHAVTADTASYFNNLLGTVASASYALNADTASSVFNDTVPSASFLVYSPDNGTASYAIQAGSVAGIMGNFGLFPAEFQTISASGINNISVLSSLAIEQETMIQAFGNVIVNFTASTPDTDYKLRLVGVDRKTGERSVLDSSKMNFNITPLINVWSMVGSGSMAMPFNLITQQPLYGEYYLAVSSSSPYLQIDEDRDVVFSVSSYSDVVTAGFDVPMEFYVSPSSSVTISFSSSALPGQVVRDYLPGFLQTSSLLITEVNVYSQSVNSVLFTWTLPNLRKFYCGTNPSLTDLSYTFSNALEVLSCDDCSITTISSLGDTTASVLTCRNNMIMSLPTLSPSMSYIDCANNPLVVLPAFLPITLQTLRASDTALTGTVPNLPNGFVRGEFHNTIISVLPNPLPLSLSYFDIHQTLVATMSAAPVSLSYLDVSSASFDDVALDNVSTYLVNNGQNSGTFLLRGYGPPASLTLQTNIATLTASATRHWTVAHD